MVTNLKKKFFKKDHLLPLKISEFLAALGMQAIFPFMTLFMRDLGLTLTQMSFIKSIGAVVQSLTPIIIGPMVDSTGKCNVWTGVFRLLWIFTLTSLIFVPKSYVSPVLPLNNIINADLECDANGNWINLIGCVNELPRNLTLAVSNCYNTLENHNLAEVCMGNSTFTYCHIFHPNINKTIFIENSSFSKLESNLQNHSYTIASFSMKNKYYKTLACPSPRQDMITTCNLMIAPNFCAEFSNSKTLSEYSNSKTFYIYTLINTFMNIFISASGSTLRLLILLATFQHKGFYGTVIVYFYIATIIMSPISGYLIEIFSYPIGFGLFMIISLPSAICLFLQKVKNNGSEKKVKKKMYAFLKDIKVVVFLFFIFIHRVIHSLLDNFLFLFLTDEGASKSFLGLTLIVKNIPAILILFCSKYYINSFGEISVICLSFIYLGIRCIGYSFLTDTREAFLFEIFAAFTHQLPNMMFSLYAEKLAPKGSIATLLGFIGAFRQGVGNVIGPLIMAQMITKFGYRITFQIVGTTSLIVALIHYGIYRCLFAVKISKVNGSQTSTVNS